MNLQPLPENGERLDFKRAFLKTIPPRPFYHRRSVFKQRNLLYCVITNGIVSFNYLVSFLVNVYCQEVTVGNTLTTLGVTLIEIYVVIWTYRSTRRSEDSIEQSFYKFVEHLAHLEICPRNAPETWLEVWNTHRLMANINRRARRSVGEHLKVWMYNLLHRASRKCHTCLQIQHAYENNNCEYRENKKRYKFENCPFCGWDY